MPRIDELDVAIVHEWLTNLAGSEQCVLAMRDGFPSNTVYASVWNPDVFPELTGAVRTSALQRIPAFRRSHLRALPLMVPAMRALRIADDHDVVLRSFHSFSTLPPQPAGVPELVYCHCPPRFLYRAGTLGRERFVIRAGASVAGFALRPGDRARLRRADRVVANSSAVAARIADAYGVEAGVVHPPVDIERFTSHAAAERDDFFLWFGRLVPYKRPDLAVEAFRGLPHRLVVAGDGRMREQLARDAPPNVTFIGRVADDELPALLARARAVVFPGEEDFGIAPVEALAAGTPVIAYGAGGALDYIRSGVNGILFDHQTRAGLTEAIVAATERSFDHAAVADSARPFSRTRFVDQITAEVAALVTGGVRRSAA